MNYTQGSNCLRAVGAEKRICGSYLDSTSTKRVLGYLWKPNIIHRQSWLRMWLFRKFVSWQTTKCKCYILHYVSHLTPLTWILFSHQIYTDLKNDQFWSLRGWIQPMGWKVGSLITGIRPWHKEHTFKVSVWQFGRGNPCSGLQGFPTELTPRVIPCCIVRILEECICTICSSRTTEVLFWYPFSVDCIKSFWTNLVD